MSTTVAYCFKAYVHSKILGIESTKTFGQVFVKIFILGNFAARLGRREIKIIAKIFFSRVLYRLHETRESHLICILCAMIDFSILPVNKVYLESDFDVNL